MILKKCHLRAKISWHEAKQRWTLSEMENKKSRSLCTAVIHARTHARTKKKPTWIFNFTNISFFFKFYKFIQIYFLSCNLSHVARHSSAAVNMQISTFQKKKII